MDKESIFADIDIFFAKWISGFDKQNDPFVFVAAALASRETRDGHICVRLDKYAGKRLDDYTCPDIEKWLEILEQTYCIGSPEDFKPLILKKGKLYLHRFWQYQENIVKYIKNQEALISKKPDMESAKNALTKLFDIKDRSEGSQIIAAVSAISNNFTVITGGPGTGKTTTAAKILAAVIDIEKNKNIKIALAAPTGKAAIRLKQAMLHVKSELDFDSETLKKIPENSYTIHRLLGRRSNLSGCYHNKEKPLYFDIILIDEASMIDIALMSSLIEALLPDTKLILLGDKDQLSSVAPGSVLADICSIGKKRAFCDNIIELETSFRFDEKSGIKKLSTLVNNKKAEDALAYLKEKKGKNIGFFSIYDKADLYSELKNICTSAYKDYIRADDPAESLFLFNRSKILCAVRKGYYGVSALNGYIEEILEQEGLISTEKRWYHKKPVLITKNDYDTNLFNGDTGVVFNNEVLSSYAVFPDDNDAVQRISCKRLTFYDTAYAMTVHKSQGSEFEDIFLILPDRDYPVLTKELIYTAITRAKEKVFILGSEEVFITAVKRSTERTSGFEDVL